MVATERATASASLAHRPALLAHHPLHGPDALRRQRGRQLGNTHIALGRAYQDAYDGDPGTLKPEDWERLGYNNATRPHQLISTTRRTVTATLSDGSERVIYRDGEFVLD